MPIKLCMKKTSMTAILMLSLAIALWTISAAPAQNQEEPSLFGGILLESPPSAPSDLVVVAVSDSQITIAWRDNSSDETRFEIWRAVFSSDLYLWSQVGDNVTTYTDSGLESGTTYSYMVRARNNDGYSDSNVVSATTSGDIDEYVYVNCFIATAVYRDAFHPDVQALRNFRDKYLATNPVGRALVSLYYRYSPPVASFIAAHEVLRVPLRAAFVPVAAAARHPFAALVVFAGVIVCGAGILKRRRK